MLRQSDCLRQKADERSSLSVLPLADQRVFVISVRLSGRDVAGREPTEISNEEPAALNQRDAEPGKSTSQESVNSLEEPPPIPRIANGAAVIGKPYGAGRLTIPIGKQSVWRADQPIRVQAIGDRLLFPCHHVRPGDQGEELVIHFLFRGTETLVVNVASASVTLADGLIRVDEGHASHKPLIDDWWSNYAKQLVDGPSEELSRIGRDTVTILGRQLGLRGWWPLGSDLAQSSELEKQFERTMGMLLGFESVRLAMMKDTSAVTTDEGPAALKLPRPFQMRAVPVPAMPPNSVKIERLAFHVPSEYFYLRCQSLRNYLWMRNLVKGWGGSLDQMVATPVVEHRVRERIEWQLCLDPSLALALDLDASLDDFAIVGGDTYFAEGAALGVLMLANKPARVESVLDEMRRAMAASGSARHRTLTISGRTVSLYETSDNTIRSFYAVNGDCHLVTNSEMLVQHFFNCDSGQNLASSAEFRYARSKFPVTRDITSFLYLSDPFFRRLTSPATRIEASRRQRAAAELRQLKLARLLFAAQGLDGDDSLANLVQHRLLESTFGTRADGSFQNSGKMVRSWIHCGEASEHFCRSRTSLSPKPLVKRSGPAL